MSLIYQVLKQYIINTALDIKINIIQSPIKCWFSSKFISF